jgi:hypothetical protein
MVPASAEVAARSHSHHWRIGAEMIEACVSSPRGVFSAALSQ